MKYFLLLFLLSACKLYARTGFYLSNDEKVIIPFKHVSNLILLPVNVNGTDLTFILDSGISETLLFSLDNQQLNFSNAEKMAFNGLGGNVDIEGIRSSGNKLTINKNYIDTAHDIYIILDEDFNLSGHLGIPIHGIIGYHFFERYPVEINYITETITIYPDIKQVKGLTRRYREFPISIERNKPYLWADVKLYKEYIPAKLLIDLGNSDPLWLFPSRIAHFTYKSNVIEDDYLGRGFNGDVKGKRGRIHSIRIGDFNIPYPIVSFPSEASIGSVNFVEDRVGSIGNAVMDKFRIVFDYPHRKIYLKKNKYYSAPFILNISGIDIKHDGMEWSQELVRMDIASQKQKTDYTMHEGSVAYDNGTMLQYKFALRPVYRVIGIRTGSAGEKAGIQVGDKLISIEQQNVNKLSLEEIFNRLNAKEDKTITMVVERNSKQLLVRYTVPKDPIPFIAPG